MPTIRILLIQITSMAKSFGDVKGAATKTKREQYKYKMGENRIRLVGDLLPRYVYWITGENNKAIPFECLALPGSR